MQKRARTASDRYFWTSNAFSRRFAWSFLARPAAARADRSVTDDVNFVLVLLLILTPQVLHLQRAPLRREASCWSDW